MNKMRLFDYSINLELRLFYVLAWTAAIANTLGFVTNVIFFGFDTTSVFCGVCTLLMFALGFAGIRSVRVYPYCITMSVILIFIEFPYLYYMYGPGRFGYMYLGIIGLLVFLNRKHRIALTVAAILYDTAVIILSGVFQSDTVPARLADDLGATVISFLIAVVSTSLIVYLLIIQYERQSRELRNITDELRESANLDPLTHLYNRRFLTEYLDIKMMPDAPPFAIALIDLDDFKSVNDRFGHLYGDEVLQALADSMKENMRGNGIAARFGGEEFMLVFDNADREHIAGILDRIQLDLNNFASRTRDIGLSFSGGVEMLRRDNRITQLFNAADEKLYIAKNSGKHRVVYDSKLAG